jgi:hypothetical protein
LGRQEGLADALKAQGRRAAISERTQAALAAAEARRTRLGCETPLAGAVKRMCSACGAQAAQFCGQRLADYSGHSGGRRLLLAAILLAARLSRRSLPTQNLPHLHRRADDPVSGVRLGQVQQAPEQRASVYG